MLGVDNPEGIELLKLSLGSVGLSMIVWALRKIGVKFRLGSADRHSVFFRLTDYLIAAVFFVCFVSFLVAFTFLGLVDLIGFAWWHSAIVLISFLIVIAFSYVRLRTGK